MAVRGVAHPVTSPLAAVWAGALAKHERANAASLANAFTPFAGPQTAFNLATEYEVLYGGAKGPGKTHALLFKGFHELANPNAHFLFLRVDYPSLAEAMDRADEIFPRFGATYVDKHKLWTFPSGALYEFGYAETLKDIRRYSGREPTRLKYDEVGQLADERVWSTMLAELRSPDKTLIRQAEASANPGGPGEPWLMSRFVKPCGEDGNRVYVDPAEPTMTRRFIPARVTDNPIYANDEKYMATLRSLPHRQRQQLLGGKWGVGVGRGLDELTEVRHIVPAFQVPSHWTVWGAFDWGFGHPFSFGWFAADEDGNAYLVDSVAGHRMLPWEQAERIRERAPERARAVVYAGHDCWNEVKARDERTPTIAETFKQYGILLKKANISRVTGLNNLREWIKWQGPDEETWTPRFRIMDTPSNRRVYDVLEGMMTDPDDPEDVIKRDANSDTGEGGDDPYDMVRYGMAARPAKTRSNEDPDANEISAFDPDVLHRAAEESRKLKPRLERRRKGIRQIIDSGDY